jgi:hypothetical protein
MRSHTAIIIVGTLVAARLEAQTVTLPAASPRAEVTQTVGITEISVDYSRPSVNGRQLWGGLVPYGFNNLGFGTAEESPWRAGADLNTVFSFSDPVTVQGASLPAGDYGFFLAIEEDHTATAIFSTNATSWGSYYYDPAEDALRVDTQLVDSSPFVEQLTFRISDVTDDSATITLLWGDKAIPLAIEVDTPQLVLANLKRELRSGAQFGDEGYANAANYLLNHDLELETALAWADHAINDGFVGQRTFGNLSLKARILQKMGREEEAAVVMDEALPVANIFQIHQYGRQLIASGQPQKALEVFQYNADRFPGQWPTAYGLARAYSALGEFEKAVEFLEQAKENIPEGDLLNPPAIEANLEKLRNGEDIN